QAALCGDVRSGGAGISNSHADAKHQLRRELICSSEPWTERPRLVLRERAIATVRSVAFEGDRTGQVAGSGIWCCRRKLSETSILLFQICRIVPPQSVIQGELAGDFPRVL